MSTSIVLQSVPTGLSPLGILVVLLLLAIGVVITQKLLAIAWKLLLIGVLVVVVLLVLGVAV
jgi:hypothetical protein